MENLLNLGGCEETGVDSILKYRLPSMAKSDRSKSVNSTARKDNLETFSMMNDNPGSVGLTNDADKFHIVREWIFQNYSDLVGHAGVSSRAYENEESSQSSANHRNKSYRMYASMDGSSRGSQMGSDHAELLRKLEDLRLEICRTYDRPERTANTVVPEDRTIHTSLPRPFAQPNPAEQHPYIKQYFGQFPYIPGSGANTPDIYSYPGYLPNYPIEYQDQFELPMQKPSHQFAPKSVLGSPIRDRTELGEDLFAMHPQDSFLHPHMCSCFSCSQKYRPQFRSPVHQATFGISGIPKSPSTSDLYHRTDSVMIWPPHNVPSVASTSARSLHSKLPGSWPSDVQSDMDNLRTRRRSLIVHQSFKKFSYPLAGGAPFTSCPKCSELLKLPHVFKMKRLSMQNLQCGACFRVFQVDLGNRKRAMFIQRKFPLVDENGFQEAGNERSESPDRCSIACGTHYDEGYAVEALSVAIDNSNLEFQPENAQHSDQKKDRELPASMSQRSKSFTSVSSEDSILSNNVLIGRLLQGMSKYPNPPEHEELNANSDRNSASFVSSQEQNLSNDVIAGRIPENSLQNIHTENQEANAYTDRNSKSITASSVSSEKEELSSNMIVNGITEEESQKINQEYQHLNGRTGQISPSFTASSVASKEQNLSNHVNVEIIQREEPQWNAQMEHQGLKKRICRKSKSFPGSSILSKESNLLHDVISRFHGAGASQEPLADDSSSASLIVDSIKNLQDSFMEIGQSHSRAETESNEIDTVKSHKEKTVNESDIDFSFISCLSSNEFVDEWLSVDENSSTNVGEWSESTTASFVRKSYKELSRYHPNEDDERTNVTINGHAITKQNLKKAEMLAGRVLPGNFWYDYHGGFWGVMGEHCLGIIPPFINEFNYPMLPNCAAGNTDVFVNGRELHQLDLELLSTRGLPTTRNRHYKINISGTVYDERTGEELRSLGLLAPSVLKAKKGFGMGVPAKYEYSVNRR